MTVHELSRADARRIAVRAQLDRTHPADLLDVVRQLTLLQVDLTAAVAPSADLMLWSRLGSSYAPDELEVALANQTLIELRGMIRPRRDLALYRAEMADWPGRGELREWEEDLRDWVGANDACRLDILDRLRDDGPLPARELPDTCDVPWRSSGWNNNRNVIKLLELMAGARRGRRRRAGRAAIACGTWPSVCSPTPRGPVDRGAPDPGRATAAVAGHRAGPRRRTPVEPLDVGEVGEPAVVDGVRGTWRVDPAAAGSAVLRPGGPTVAARSPGLRPQADDRTLRVRLPAGDVQAGGQASVGLLGAARSSTATGWSGSSTPPPIAGPRVLRVDAIHQDVPFTKAMTTAVRREIDDWPAGSSSAWTCRPGSRSARHDVPSPAPTVRFGADVSRRHLQHVCCTPAGSDIRGCGTDTRWIAAAVRLLDRDDPALLWDWVRAAPNSPAVETVRRPDRRPTARPRH